MLILTLHGYANILFFQNNASTMLRLVKDDTDNDIESSISKVAKHVVQDCK